MSSIFLYFFMAVGLSMDAFSLAIVYGTNEIKKKQMILLPIIVGIYHFVMPNLSGLLGRLFLLKFNSYANLVAGIVFLVLMIEMIMSFSESESKYRLDRYLELFLFGLAVSIDSFTVGLALSLSNQNVVVAGLIFSIVSCLFTMAGLLLGKLLSQKVGVISKVIGIIILLILSIKYILAYFM